MQDTLRNMRAKRAEGDRGFTLIELLVVVVIIGVLVAIAVPVYLNYRQGAADKSAQSDVRGAVSAVENFYTVNGNTYPNAPTALQEKKKKFDLDGPTGATKQSVNLSNGTQMQYKANATSTGYIICARNENGSKTYKYDSAAGGSVEATADVDVAACIGP